MGPLFSAIIPTLNEEKFVPRLLSNLTAQKEKDFEVIVVDSFSADATSKKVNEFQRLLPLRLFKIKTKNVSSGRNYGALKAKGSYLIFLDADSQIGPNFTKIIKQAILKNGGLVFIPAIVPDNRNLEMKVAFRFVNYLVDFSQNLNRPFSTGGSMVVEKNFFHLIGGFDEKLFLSEDHNLIQNAQKWGVRARFLHNLKLKFSMRRLRTEGRLILFYKYLWATAHVFFKGNIDQKLFSYPMGGALYAKKTIPENDLYHYLKIFGKFFQNLKEETIGK